MLDFGLEVGQKCSSRQQRAGDFKSYQFLAWGKRAVEPNFQQFQSSSNLRPVTQPLNTIHCEKLKSRLSIFFIFNLLLLFWFSLQNPSRWKAMSEEALRSVCAPGSTTSLPPLPPLCASSLDPAAASNQLELELRFLVSEHRRVNHNTKH